MPTKQVDVIFNTKNNPSGANQTVSNLQRIEQQAQKTQQTMQKLQMVGSKMAMAGGVIVAPFALAMKKYVDSAKETEPLAKNIVALNQRWEQSQVRIGRVTAEIVLPTLVKALDIVDKIAAFAEAHPDAVKAALGIGASLVVVGGAISAVGGIVSTLATIQGLAAGAGIALGGSGAAAGAAGGTAAITGAIGTIAPAVLTGITAILASPLTWAIAALALTVPIMNWLLGTDTTWKDIANTGHQALILIGMGISNILSSIGGWFSNLGNSIWAALVKAATWIVEGVGGAFARALGFVPKKDAGGSIGKGLFRNAGGTEFVVDSRTKRAAEGMIGGQLTQQRLLQGLAGGRRIEYHDNSRYNTETSLQDRRRTANFVFGRMSEALG